MKISLPTFRSGCLLAGIALAAFSVRPQDLHNVAATAPSASVSISDVAVTHAPHQTTVQIRGTQALHYQESRLDGPPRLVLDFSDTQVSFPKNKVSSEFSPVRAVRIGQPSPDKSRVVIDLTAFGPYHIEDSGASLTVSFASSEADPATAMPQMPLPSWMTSQTFALARPADIPPAPPQPSPAMGPAPQAGQVGAVPGGEAEPKYTGEPISVNLKDVDLKDFFRLIHEISGLNVVLDPSVRGTVTLVLDNVPWDQALDIVLRNNGLAKQIDGNVLRIATQDTLKHEADQRRDLTKAEQDAVEPVVVTRQLSYANATLLVPTVKKFLSTRGDVVADLRSNTLVIKDIPSDLPKIDDLIRQLDQKGKQVEIDARVVSATRSFARDVGTQFGFSTTLNNAGNTALGGLVGQTSALSPVTHIGVTPPFSTGSPSQIPLSSNFPAVAPTSGITFSTQGRNYAIDFLLTAMESKGAGKILSEPKGVTQNNQKLTVKQGTEVPIQTTVNNTISVQYVNAVLELDVTPQITAEGTVFLDVHVENTAIDQGIPLIQGIPALDTQSADTKVLITDGGTIVIGGVVLSSETTNVNQVPLIGSLPLIGHLFKETSVSVNSQELLFFLTPRILPG